MTKLHTIEWDSYNGRRYGSPWAAEVVLDGIKLSFIFIKGAYAGDDNGGDLTFEIEPDCVYAYGQKDNRGGNTQVNYISVNSAGEVSHLKNSAEARKILLQKEGV